MSRTLTLCIAFYTAAAAQDTHKLRDALEWTTALRGRMSRMTNHVVDVHGTASVAALICPEDPLTAFGIFRDAIVALDNLSDSAFTQKGTTVLPSASFTGLWKFVVPAALKCDPNLAVIAANPRSKQRMDAERRNANATLGRAWALIDPSLVLDKQDQLDRSAQLANAALDAGDPDTFDYALLNRVMSQLRDRAPDLADDLFLRALAFVMSAPVPSPDSLQQLALYLFTAPSVADKPDTDAEHESFTVNGATVENLMAGRHTGNPDDTESLIETTVRLLNSQTAVARNPTVAWALGWQLVPRARDLAPDRVTQLEDALAAIQTQYGVAATQIQARLGAAENPDPESGGPAYRNFWLVGQIQNALAANRVADAHAFLDRMSDVPARSQLAAIVAFYEAAAAIAAHRDQALSLADQLHGGIKRALLYTAMIAATRESDTAVQIMSLAAKDVATLPAEARVRLLSALSTALLRTNEDAAVATLREVVKAANDVYVSPRRGRFDPQSARRAYNPRATTSDDSALIVGGTRGFYEAVETERGRHNFMLRVSGSAAFSIAAFLDTAGAVDYARLEANLLELRDEATRAASLVKLGEVRIKTAKVAH